MSEHEVLCDVDPCRRINIFVVFFKIMSPHRQTPYQTKSAAQWAAPSQGAAADLGRHAPRAHRVMAAGRHHRNQPTGMFSG